MEVPERKKALGWRISLAPHVLLLAFAATAPSHAQFNARGRRPPAAGSNAPTRATPSAGARPKEATAPASHTSSTATAAAEERVVLIERYRKIVLDRPGDQVAMQRLMDLVRERDGNLTTLAAELEQLVRNDGESAYAAQLALAEVSKSGGDFARARRELSEIVTKWPKRPEGHLAWARLTRSTGDLAAARVGLERALPLQTGQAKEETLSDLWQICLELSDLECARSYHGALVQAARGNAFVAGELGRALLARGQNAEALLELRRVARGAEGDRRALVPALRDLGKAELVSGDPTAALRTLERASRSSAAEPALRGEIDALRADAHRALGTLDTFLSELEHGPETAENLALLGRLHEELGQLDLAARAYRRASEMAKTDVDLRLALIRVLELTLDLAGAEKELAILVRQTPGQIDLVLRYIDLLLAAGKRDQALVEFDRAVAAFDRDASASFLLLELAERLQESERVRKVEQAQAAKAGLSQKHLVELGSRAYRQGDGDKARTIWKRLLSERGGTRGAVLYGETLLAHDDVKGGLSVLERAVEEAPTEIEPKVALARGLLRAAALATGPTKKDYERRALVAWTTVLEDPHADRTFDRGTRAEARRQVVRLLKRTGRLTVEMAALERAFLGPGRDTEAGLTLAEAQVLTRSLGEAERTLTRLHELLPGNQSVLLRLERVQLDQGKTEAAIGTLERLLAIDPARSRETLGRLADLAFDLHDDERAISYAERAVALDSSDAEALSKLGTLYERGGRLGDAESTYRKALAQDAQLHGVTIKLSRLLGKRGEHEEALGVLLRSLRNARRADDVTLLGKQALATAVSADLLRELEDQLRPLCISRPEAQMLRALLLDVVSQERLALEDQLEHETPVGEARTRLAELSNRNLGPLLSVLAAAELEQKEQAILLLSWGSADGASAALLEFAEGTAPEPLRIAAVEAATRQGDEKVAARAVMVLRKKGPSPRGALALAIVRGLGRMPGGEARRGLELALSSEDPSIRAEALFALSKRSPPLAEASLIRILSSGTEGDAGRAAAALSLGTGPRSKAAHAALVEALRHESALVQASALVALATRAPNDRLFIESATGMLFDPDPRRAAVAMRALVIADPELASAPSARRQDSNTLGSSSSVRVEDRLWQAMTIAPIPKERLRVLRRHEADLVRALEVALKTSRTSAVQALRAMARSNAQAALAPLFSPDDPVKGDLSELNQEASTRARAIHQSVLPWVIAHVDGSDRELATLALGTLCPDQGQFSRSALERALRAEDDAKFEAAAFAMAECKLEVALPLLVALLETKLPWARERRLVAVLEEMGSKQKQSVDPVIRRLLTRLAKSENELVRTRSVAALENLGLSQEPTE